MADGNGFLSWGSKPRLHMVMQAETTECALACLTMIAHYHGHEATLASFRRRFGTSLRGAHLSRVIEIAQTLGFETRPLRAELKYLSGARLPCILHWDLNHFVVLSQVTRRRIEIYDPARGKHSLSLEEASRHFTGIVLELTPGNDFSRVSQRTRISLRMLTGRVTGLTRALIQVMGLALGIEGLALFLPFQMQWVLDQVLISADRSLLLILTFGFLAIVVLSTALKLMRAWVISWLGATINAQWTTNLFSHLLKLPLGYFERRHIGDVVSRFTSIQSIQDTVTGSFVEAVLDGLMGSLAMVILFLYDPALTALVVATFLLYTALRWAAYRTLWRIKEEQLIYGARQQTELLESVRGVQAIKLANKQVERRTRLAIATLESAKCTMLSQRITLAFGVINQNLFAAQRILLIALGAYLAMRGRFSAGMLVAYVAYADQFAMKIGGLVDKVVDFQILKLHAERVADIALAEPEPHAESLYSGPEPEARLDIKNLSFRYADGEPWVLRNLNLSIQPGESVAIIGPSGYGKSTLAKLMVGLLEPIEGDIEIGGINIRKYGLDRYRKLIGAVMQDDTLFAGSIADNITLFDEEAQMNDIISAAMTAEIHQDVMAMPMAYESTVGDMGSALSGGQKQRLLLARAIYRKPKLLVLDEATSHLDQGREALINDRVRHMKMTRIIIAHRRETIASADRIINLETEHVQNHEVAA